MPKTSIKMDNGFWIAVAAVVIAVMYKDAIFAMLGGGTQLQLTPVQDLPDDVGGSCTDYDLNIEFVRYFGAANMQALGNACINGGGDWTNAESEVSCHYPNTVSINCSQPALYYVKSLCGNLKATYTCSNTTKFIGCLCNLAAPTAPLDGFPADDEQDESDEGIECGWQESVILFPQCTGLCPTSMSCEIVGQDCKCVGETQYVAGQVGSVFISSGTWNGAMGGAVGADEKCDVAAEYAGFPGNWRAIISDDSQAVRSKLPDSTAIPYYLLDGVKLANSASDLFDGAILNAINVDEHLNKVSGKKVWTGSTADGQSTGTNCHNWGWVSATGTAGSSDSNFAPWINEAADACSVGKRLYCARVS